MKIKRYIVNSMNEAMNMIRYDLGREAVIISQRKVRKPGIMGFFAKRQIEVTAAVDTKKPEEVKTDKPAEQSLDVMKELFNMRMALNEMKEGNVPSQKEVKKSKLQSKLESSDVRESIIKKVAASIKGMKNEAEEGEKVRKSIDKLVSISDYKLDGRVILIGPTGVGKTTTLAKIAGRLTLVDKKKVGLLTIDTYRIGAVDQLKTYADILNLPFKVVLSIKDMEAAIESMQDCDIILIDTTGRSSKNAMQISELRAFIEKANPTSIHLVVSCTTKEKDIAAITEGFKDLNYDSVIITKLDETTTYGSILNILDSAKKPLSFVTTGQNVPDDLMRITKAQISDLILGEYE